MGSRSNKNIFMDYQRSAVDNIFKPQKRLDELISQDKSLLTDLIVARKMAEKAIVPIFLVKTAVIYSAVLMTHLLKAIHLS